MSDKFKIFKSGNLGDPAYDAFSIGTANSANAFTQPTRALYVGVTGNVEVRMAGTSNVIVLLQGVQAGQFLPLRVVAVCGNTTSNGLIGFY